MVNFEEFKKKVEEFDKSFFETNKEAFLKVSIDKDFNSKIEVDGTKNLLMNALAGICAALKEDDSMSDDEIMTAVSVGLAQVNDD